MQFTESTMNQAFLKKLTEIVLDNLQNEQFGVEELSRQIGISRSHLHRKLKLLTGKSVSQFIREIRLEQATEMLKKDVATTSEIAYHVGFSSPSYFHKCFQKLYGFPPGEVKKRIENHQAIEPSLTKNQAGSVSSIKQLIDNHPRLIAVTTATAVVMSIIFMGIFGYQRISSGPKQTPAQKSIAVLPFKSLSSDEKNQHFTDGLVDDLLSRLALISEFKVISRTSSDAFRERGNKLVPQIATELGVTHIVEGSVQKQGNKVRIIVQLIDAVHDDHVWIKTFERDLLDLFKIQSEIAIDVASALSMVLTEQQTLDIQKNQTEIVKAMELYQLGRHNWGKRTRGGLNSAIEYFQQAIEEDPDYALAYAGLADTYYLKAFSDDLVIRKENRSKGLYFADKALKLDPQSVEAYTVLASVHSFFDCNWSTAEEEFKLGISLNRNYSTLFQRYSEHLMNSGRAQEARETINKAVALDPLSFVVRIVSAENFYDNGHFEEALHELKICQDLILNKFHWRAHGLLFAVYCQLEKNDEVLKVHKLFEKNWNEEFYNEPLIDSLYKASGKNGIIKRHIEVTESPFNKALLNGLLGNKENCIEWLEKSIMGDPNCTFPSYYEFRIVHNDPRYISLLNQAGLPWKPGDNQ